MKASRTDRIVLLGSTRSRGTMTTFDWTDWDAAFDSLRDYQRDAVRAAERYIAEANDSTGSFIVAMPTGILASAFAEEFRERHEAKKKAKEVRAAD